MARESAPPEKGTVFECPTIFENVRKLRGPNFDFLTRVAARPGPGDPGLIHPALAAAAGGVPVGPGGPKWEFPKYFKALASGPFRAFHRRPGWVWFVRIKGRRPPAICETRFQVQIRGEPL